MRLAVAAVALFSTSAVLVRMAQGFGPLEVASYRLIAGALFIGLIAAATGSGLRPAGAPGPLLAAGAAAAVHFGFYIASLYRTSITHSLVLVNLSPVLAMPLATVFLGEPFERRRVPGVLLTIAGLAVMVGLEPTLTRDNLVGDAMALLAALAYAVYSIIGRTQRRGVSLLTYTFWVYLTAGVLLLPPALWQAGLFAGWSGPGAAVTGLAAGAGAGAAAAAPADGGLLPGVAAILLLALLPTAGGHTLYNAALRRADAVTVNLIATQEVTGGVLLGLLFLGEAPTLQAAAGGLLALFGLYLVLRR